MRRHTLKTWPEPFQAILDGKKRCEIRVDDRGFAVGDVLHLTEWEPSPVGNYTDRSIDARVTYVTMGGQWGLPSHVCVMSIEIVDVKADRCCLASGFPPHDHASTCRNSGD